MISKVASLGLADWQKKVLAARKPFGDVGYVISTCVDGGGSCAERCDRIQREDVRLRQLDIAA